MSLAKVRPFIVAADWTPSRIDGAEDLRTPLVVPERQLELFG